MPNPIHRLTAAILAAALAASCGYDDSEYVPAGEALEPGAPAEPPATEPPSPTNVPCSTALECDDDSACTVDACEGGYCTHARIVACVEQPL